MTAVATEADRNTDSVVGHRYRVNTRNPEGAILEVGATVECVRIYGTSARFQSIGEHDTPEGREWIIYRRHLDDLPRVGGEEPMVPDVVSQPEHDRILLERDARIEALTNRIAEMETTHRASLDRLNARLAGFTTDVTTWNRVLLEAADHNGLCGVFDSTIDEGNSQTSHIQFEGREYTHEYTREVEVTVRVTVNGSYEGQTRDQDSVDEDDVEWSDISTEDIVRAVRDGSWDEGDVVDDSFANA